MPVLLRLWKLCIANIFKEVNYFTICQILVLFSSAYFLIRQQLYILSQKISAQDLKVAHIPQLLARTVANFSKAYIAERALLC
jgi:hypothetical protein